MSNATNFPQASKSFMEGIDRSIKKMHAEIERIESNRDLNVDAILRMTGEAKETARARIVNDGRGALRVTSNWVDQVEQQIGAARSKAATSADWHMLGIRAKEYESVIAGLVDNPLQGVTVAGQARRLRDELAAQGDVEGLRALRMATRAHLPQWSHSDNPGHRDARYLSEAFKADERAAIPGIDDLEAELSRAKLAHYEAQRAVQLAGWELEPDKGYHSRSTGIPSALEKELGSRARTDVFDLPAERPAVPNGADILWGPRESA